jgi:hypothetical protein
MSGRPSARIFSAAPLIGAILCVAVLAGCYGQTDLATQVDSTSATLNARGAATNGPASAYFEYWKDATPQTKLQTAPKSIPAGASGPFSQRATGLTSYTHYSYRLCGSDQGGSPVCAQTRSFLTGGISIQAYGDTASPYGYNGWDRIDVNVAATATGASPIGRVFARFYNAETGPPGGIALETGSTTEDNVTCVNVQGNVAVIGYRQVPPYPDDIPLGNNAFAYLVDGGPAGSGKDRFSAGPTFEERDPADCSVPADTSSLTPLRKGELSISAP